MNKVVIAKGNTALNYIFEELNLFKALENKERVVIKPNLRAAAVENYSACAITNLTVIKDLTNKLLDMGLSVTIGECTSSRYITEKALIRSGVKKLASRNVEILNLNKESTKKIEIPYTKLKTIEVPRPILETDFLISLPVMKTHTLTLVSLSMKNMMGATGETTPPKMHLKGISQSIVDINKVISPDLSIIDATRAMEGTGPNLGTEVKLDTLIGGFDPVSVDSIGAKMMGFDPYIIEHLVLAEKENVGRIEPDKIVGELNVKKFKESRHGVILDMYSYNWFNLLMTNKVVHSIVYDYSYFLIKRLLDRIRSRDREDNIKI